MHIQKIEIENVRGITHWEEELGNENIRILGPNGSGKSSVIQSVEFVLTGDISRLRGTGTQDIPFAEYASHVEADPGEAWVTATFARDGDRNVTMKRWISEPDNPKIVKPSDLNDVPDWLQEQMAAAKLGHSILDRDRLLRFVTAPEGKRGDRIDELFGIEQVDTKRRSLKEAVRKHKKDDHQKVAKEKDKADQRFFDLFPSGVSTRSSALEHINERREEHGVQKLESLSEDFTRNVEMGEEISVDALQSEGTVSLLKQIADQFEKQREEFRTKLEILCNKTSELQTEDDLERELDTLELVENGLSVADRYDGQCPLCLEEWDDDELQNHLEDRRNHASHLQDLKQQLESKYDEMNDLIIEYTDDLASLRSELQEDYPEATTQIAQVTERARSWKEDFNKGSLSDLSAVSDSETRVFPEAIRNEIHRLLEEAEEKPALKSTTENVDLLVRADDRYAELMNREQEEENAETIQTVLSDVEQHFLDSRSRVLTEAFTEIRTRFEEYYEEMHRDEEAADFSAILEPTDTGVRFEPEFYDKGHHHPGAVHSEGHRDSMGLALFLAMSDVGGEAIDILLLDDVMMSIDSGHRSNIANLLAGDVSERYQILLTTHDKTWDRHLHLTQEFEKQVRFSKCSLEGGPFPVGDISDPWGRIKHHIDREDVTAAAAWIRKTVEWFSRRTCAELKADVPYHKLEAQELGLNQLFQSAIGEYQSLLENGRVVEETDYHQSLYEQDDVNNDLEAIDEVKQDIDRYLNLLHRNVHHNDAESAYYTGEELKNERNMFKRAYDLFYCSDCRSWVKKGDYVYCDCTIRVEA